MSPLPRAPQRPRTRDTDIVRRAVGVDRANPTSPAGSDPRKIAALLQLEPKRRGRHGDILDGGTYRWPR